MPLLMKTAQVVKDLADWFSALPEPVKQAMAVIGGLTAVAGPMLMALGSMIQGWTGLVNLFGRAKDVAKEVSGALNVTTGALGGWLGPITAAAVALGVFIAWIQSTNAYLDSMAQKIWADKDAVDALNASLQRYREFLSTKGLDKLQSERDTLLQRRNESIVKRDEAAKDKDWHWNPTQWDSRKMDPYTARGIFNEEAAEVKRLDERLKVVRDRIKEIKSGLSSSSSPSAAGVSRAAPASSALPDIQSRAADALARQRVIKADVGELFPGGATGPNTSTRILPGDIGDSVNGVAARAEAARNPSSNTSGSGGAGADGSAKLLQEQNNLLGNVLQELQKLNRPGVSS